jgi:release factor glutamine methyltransferase
MEAEPGSPWPADPNLAAADRPGGNIIPGRRFTERERIVTVESRKPAVDSGEVWTVARILEWTTRYLKQHGSDTPRLDAEILLAHTRNCPRIQLYTHFEDVLSDEHRATMRDLVRRRAQAEPVAYLVGHREFYGLDFRVSSDVLIPRPDTETLVLELLELAKPLEQPRILDVGTGSGCIAVTAAVNARTADLTASDISPAALQIARENAERHKVSERVRFLEGDLFAPVPAGEQFDLIASNPPYIAEADLAELDADVRNHEPRLALDGGPAGMVVLCRIVQEAVPFLKPGGALLLEIDPSQPEMTRGVVEGTHAYEDIRVVKDLAGRPRVVIARKIKE